MKAELLFARLRKGLFTGLLGLLVSLVGLPSVSAAVPLMGLSGRAWNAGVFTGSASAASVADFAAWRGKPVDSVLWFATRDSWANLALISNDVVNFPGVKVIALPPFPESLGSGGLAQTAAGNFNAWWTTYGQSLVSKGLNNNRTVIRLGWEMNGNWYAWSATTGQETNFINAYRNVVNSIRAGGATAVQFNWCVNKGNQSNTNGWAAYPGDAYVDILGLDIYDFWDPSFNDTQFNANAAKSPSLNDVAAYCVAHGKQMALDEWGVAHDAHGGNDNPFFIQKIWDWLNAHTSILAYETTYDDPGAPSTLHHKLSPPEGTSWNPNAGALYKSLWGSTGSTPTIPAAPTGLSATGGNTQVSLTWTASSGATSYNVYRGTSAGGESTTPVVTGVTASTYTNTGLTNGTTYYFKVKAVNSAGTSGYSNEASAAPIASSQPLANGNYTLAPANAPSLRLQATGAANGANVNIGTATGASNQQWALTSISGNVYKLVPGNATAQGLDVNGQLTTPGTNVQLWQYLGQQNQQWAVTLMSGNYMLVPQHALNLRLNVTGGGTTNGTNVDVQTDNSSTAQRWIVSPVSTGSGNTHGGTWAARGTIPASATYVAVYQQATCAQNTSYVAKVWVKGSGSFIIKTLNSSWVQIAQTTFSASSTWTEKSITFTTPNTASPGVVFYIADAGGGGTLYVDDAFMGVNGGTNVLANPGFESGSASWTVGSSVWAVLQNP